MAIGLGIYLTGDQSWMFCFGPDETKECLLLN